MLVQIEAIDSLRCPTETLQPGHIKLATGSRRTASWDQELADTDKEGLERLQYLNEGKLTQARKAVKREMGDECWETCLLISRLNIQRIKLNSRINLIKFDDEKWYEQPEAQELKLQHDVWTQWEKTLDKRLSPCTREPFLRLFSTSKVGGFDLPRQQGPRNSPYLSEMFTAMWKAYCPDAGNELFLWDPILHRYGDSNKLADGLFPSSQGAFMDDIFGEGSIQELFSPRNSLFLYFY